MTSTQVWLLAALSMAGVTLLLRLAPLLLPKAWLQSHSLRALNFALPLSVMTVLILAALPFKAAITDGNIALLLAQLGALVLVLLVYMRWRNVLVAMVVGVAAVNALLFLFQSML